MLREQEKNYTSFFQNYVKHSGIKIAIFVL